MFEPDTDSQGGEAALLEQRRLQVDGKGRFNIKLRPCEVSLVDSRGKDSAVTLMLIPVMKSVTVHKNSRWTCQQGH